MLRGMVRMVTTVAVGVNLPITNATLFISRFIVRVQRRCELRCVQHAGDHPGDHQPHRERGAAPRRASTRAVKHREGGKPSLISVARLHGYVRPMGLTRRWVNGIELADRHSRIIGRLFLGTAPARAEVGLPFKPCKALQAPRRARPMLDRWGVAVVVLQ